MAWYECNCCKGVYQDVDRKGFRYFHHCPTVPNPDYQPDPRKPNYDERDQIDRANFRDENQMTGTEPGHAGVKAEGMGRVPFSVSVKGGGR